MQPKLSNAGFEETRFTGPKTKIWIAPDLGNIVAQIGIKINI
jgi:hypothetical protein